MRTNRSNLPGMLAAAALLALLATAPGCNKTDPTAPSSWTMQLTAAPATFDVAWDGTANTSATGQSVITALIYDTTGVPQPNYAVSFSVTADSHYFVASLANNGQTVRTNSRGQAGDVLNVAWAADFTADPTSVSGRTLTVTATSGLLTKDVTVTVRAVAAAGAR